MIANKAIHSEPKNYAVLVFIPLSLHYKQKQFRFRVG